MPITITIEAADAQEVRQLVQDLAGTIANMKSEDLPVDTKVSTLDNKQTASTQQQSTGQQQQTTPQTVAPIQVPTQTQTSSPTSAGSTQTQTAATAPVQQTAPTQATAPTSAPQYDFNQLATATMQLQQAGQNVFEIFGQFGIQALNQLPKERYGEYANVLRERGAKL